MDKIISALSIHRVEITPCVIFSPLWSCWCVACSQLWVQPCFSCLFLFLSSPPHSRYGFEIFLKVIMTWKSGNLCIGTYVADWKLTRVIFLYFIPIYLSIYLSIHWQLYSTIIYIFELHWWIELYFKGGGSVMNWCEVDCCMESVFTARSKTKAFKTFVVTRCCWCIAVEGLISGH